MTKIALITTTINVPEVLELHARNVPPDCDLEVVVAGDVQTPSATRDLVNDLGGTYLGVQDDLTICWRSEGFIGTRSIQRRNLALLHALTLGPDVVVTIDDDNFPTDPGTYLSSFVEGLTGDATEVTRSSTGWYNPGHVLVPEVTHRGFPISQRRQRGTYATGRRDVTMGSNGFPPRVGVVAGLWLGDPDVDAMERIVNAPEVTGLRTNAGRASTEYGTVLEVGTWAPFNTQNTAYAWDIAPLMQCLVGVGRYDDIWMSYVARRVMDEFGYHVRYGLPIVRQLRNEHNLVADLVQEFDGYADTDDFTDVLRNVLLTRDMWTSPIDCLEEVYAHLEYVGERTRRANHAWIDDVRRAVAEGTQRRAARLNARETIGE